GPSGCGKTTTLNLIAGFVEPSAGRILIDGEDVTGRPAYLRGLGVVFQSYALFPHLSVFENVAFGLRERRVSSAEVGRRVGEALGLSDRIAVMSRGRIDQLGSPREIYERPASRFVADFIGASTVLRGRAVARDVVAIAPGLTIRVAGGESFREGQEVELAIRP